MSPPLPLVGRDAALAALRQALEQAVSGHGQLVVISGEPGIGKSTLADLIGQEAGARGVRVVFGRAWELAEAPPYFPVWSGLRALGIEPPGGNAAEVDAFHLWEQVLEQLGAAAAARPVAWILEDLHAADLQTLDLLAFLARPLRALGVLLLVTLRDRDPHIGDRTAARLARLIRDGQEIRLGPLGDAELRTLAQAVARRPLPAPSLKQLADRTGGNPLFVIECARGYRDGTPAQLPASVRELTSERIALLAEATRESLACGAIVGRDFSAAIVARMLGKLPAQVIDSADAALRAGVLIELRPGQFRFSHILVRDAVEESLAPGRRADLHARAEQALASDGDAVDVLVERARHALLAGKPEGDPVALALRAARQLAAQGAHDRALMLYARIEDACAAGLASARPDANEALFRAAVARAAGRHADARQRCEAVLAEVRAAGDGPLMARAVLDLGAELRPGTVDPALVAALREALALVPADERVLRCRLQARLAGALQPAADPQVPMAMARAAIAEARALDDPALLLEVLHSAGAALVYFATIEERLALGAEQLERATALGDAGKALGARARLALDHAEVGDFRAFDADVDHLRALSLELGHPRWRWRALLLESMRAISRGDFDLSDRCVVEVQEHASLTDDPAVFASVGAHIATRAALFHRDDLVEETLARLDELLEGIPARVILGACIRTSVLARREDHEGTARELARIRGKVPMQICEVSYLLVEAVALAGTREEQEEMRAAFLPAAGRHLVSGHVPMTYEGPFLRAIGLLDSSLGHHDRAVERLGACLEEARASGHRLWVAQLSYDLGRALAAAGRTALAASAFAEAAALAEALKMPGLVQRARVRLATCSTETTAAAREPAAAATPGALSLSREGDGWRVLAGARATFVRHSRGMELLARLVERPGEEIHVLALASDAGSSLVEADAEVLDAKALRAYRARLAAIDDALEETERSGDVGKNARLVHERDQLSAELSRAVGLGGRSRAAASATERARVNAQRRLKDALGRIAEADPQLGEAFSAAVHTGTYCCFRP